MDDLDFEDYSMLPGDTQLAISDPICNSRDLDSEELNGMYIAMCSNWTFQ